MNTAIKDPSKMTAAQLEAAMQKINEQRDADLAAIQAALNSKRDVEVQSLNDKIATFPGVVSKILGREVSVEDFINMVRAHAKGTLSYNAITSKTAKVSTPGDHSSKGNRLAEDRKPAVKAAMLLRAALIKSGKPARQMSDLETEFSVGAQTLYEYAPTKPKGATQAELDAEIAKISAPATVTAV